MLELEGLRQRQGESGKGSGRYPSGVLFRMEGPINVFIQHLCIQLLLIAMQIW